MRAVVRSGIAAAALTLSAVLALGATAAAPAVNLASAPSVTFGIYPGGGAGTVGPAGRTLAENPAKRLAALEQLRAAGEPFVLHLFASYTGRASPSAADQVGRDVTQYAAAGFQIELVLAYRPSGGAASDNVPGFVGFVRSAVDSFGANPRFVALQVTNEANVRIAPNAADGAYAGAEDALVQGVIGAKAEARKQRFDQLLVGFNWAYSLGPSEVAFWSRLGRGGPLFRRSVDWVGLDVYPATWGPKAGGSLVAATQKTMLTSLATLRNQLMPRAGLGASVQVHISENGYPTGPARTETMQVAMMKAAISTIYANRTKYRVTGYRWFDLRDADSSSSSFESHYGLMRDDYTPKAAFDAYRTLVATLTAQGRRDAGSRS